MKGAIRNALVQTLYELLNCPPTSLLTMHPAHGFFQVFHQGPDDHAADVPNRSSIRLLAKGLKLYHAFFGDRMVFGEEGHGLACVWGDVAHTAWGIKSYSSHEGLSRVPAARRSDRKTQRARSGTAGAVCYNAAAMADKLVIRGAREHNFKNLDLEIPRDSVPLFPLERKSRGGRNTR
ncbi:MAG: hypothetical protein ACREIS_02935 [Nitrospiraceae bacterium]